MKFSLIISTIGRVDDLNALFASLSRQTFSDFEVIVVDQSGDDRLAPVVAAWQSKLRLTHVAMQGRGLSRGRNRGIELATGEILTFPDDDCTYPPDTLARVAAFFDSRPEIDALTVRCDSAAGGSRISRFDESAGPVTRTNVLERLVEIAFYVRRHWLESERFDETLGVGAGTPWGADEGPDLALRLLERGARIWYLPDVVLLHPCPLQTVNQAVLRRSYSYSCGRGRLFRLHAFPWTTVGASMLRSLAGCCWNLLLLRPAWARYYWLAFRGKVRGYWSRI
jgi:glycosyltransferase involved in cell wall biosynthesis